MPIPLILQLVGPMLTELLTQAFKRLTTQVKSTMVGGGIFAGIVGLTQLMGCDLPLGEAAALGAIAAAPQLFGVDSNQAMPTLIQAMKDRVEQEKRSRQVLKEAQQAQEEAAKKFNIPSWLPVILLGLAVSACSAVQIQKAQAVIVKLKADAQKVAIVGCQNYPTVDVLMETALALLPPGTTIDAIEQGYRVAEPQIEAFCKKLQERLLPAPPLPDASPAQPS